MVGEQDRQGLAPAPYWSKAAAAPLLVPSSSHDSWAAGWRCSSPAWTARTTRYRRYCGCCWRRGLGQPSSSACWSSTPMGEPPAALRRATRGAALLQRVRVLQAAGSPRRSPRCTCPSYIFLLAPPLHVPRSSISVPTQNWLPIRSLPSIPEARRSGPAGLALVFSFALF